MNAVGFAWRSLVRQPARASLGVLGVAAVGALLFDMLLLSQGLILSMGDLLERTGWDVRVSLGEDGPGRGRSGVIEPVSDVLADVAALSSVRTVIAIRFADAQVEGPGGASAFAVPRIRGSLGAVRICVASSLFYTLILKQEQYIKGYFFCSNLGNV